MAALFQHFQDGDEGVSHRRASGLGKWVGGGGVWWLRPHVAS